MTGFRERANEGEREYYSSNILKQLRKNFKTGNLNCSISHQATPFSSLSHGSQLALEIPLSLRPAVDASCLGVYEGDQ